MKYKKKVKEEIEKIIDKSTDGIYDKIMNRYSTGGKIERSMKKKIGDKVNKNDTRYNPTEKAYEVIDKVYRKINHQE